MPEDVLSLLMPTFSGSKNEFRIEHESRRPLSFERVNEGRLPVSAAPLFTKLPLEILDLINQHVPASSLASFALVNSDCRQLARSRQFACVKFDYSNVSTALIHALTMEVQARLRSNGVTRKPSLGVCIRRITVATNPEWVSRRHQISLTQRFADLDEDLRDQRITAAEKSSFGTYLPAVRSLLRNRIGLPHLELLEWDDRLALSEAFFKDLASSTIQHLELPSVAVDEEFEVQLVDADNPCGLQLRTLHLKVMWDPIARKQGNTSPLCASILRLCAPTLECLTWEGMPWSGNDSQSFAAGGLELPAFPCLRYLRFELINLHDSSILDSMIHDGLVALEIDIAERPINSTFFKKRGRIPSLEVFVWDSIRIPESQSLAFVRANPQLSRLSIAGAMSTTLLEHELLPLLSESFRHLASLNLAWKSSHISNWALKNISSLKTLQQLHLCAGDRYDRRTDWAINHNSVRGYLRKLPLLKKVAFSCDSYKGPDQDSKVDRYYEDMILDMDGEDWLMNLQMGREARDRLWEQIHRERMVTEANKYARAMGNLEWMYIGQLPMSVEHDPKTKERVAIPLTEDRDTCWSLLKDIFGWKKM